MYGLSKNKVLHPFKKNISLFSKYFPEFHRDPVLCMFFVGERGKSPATPMVLVFFPTGTLESLVHLYIPTQICILAGLI